MHLLNGDSINTVNNSQPAVTDWDRDGRKDLLLGSEVGYVRLYLNQTTDTWPMFQDYSYVMAGGSPIYLYRVNPYVVDLDQDGRRDLVCGANDGYVYYYHNSGSDTNPLLAAGVRLTTTTGIPIQPGGTNPYGSRMGFGDWNNDGIPDFLISGYDGLVELYLGAPPSGIPVSAACPGLLGLTVTPSAGRGQFTCSYRLAQRSVVNLTILDIAGRERAFIVRGTCEPGVHTALWHTSGSPGAYFCRLATTTGTVTRRFLVTR